VASVSTALFLYGLKHLTFYRPNLVTLSGFIVNLIPLILCQFLYGSSLEGPVDSWWCFVIAFTYIFYTVMDNSDGKQARRTGASSPVGMLFDHFCDAQIAVINCFTIERMLQVGNSKHAMWFIMITTCPFYYVLME